MCGILGRVYTATMHIITLCSACFNAYPEYVPVQLVDMTTLNDSTVEQDFPSPDRGFLRKTSSSVNTFHADCD